MSELDRFKRRLVRSVSRLLLRERRPPEEVWETLRKGTGKDCKELWSRMRTLTIKKLSRLLAADDYPAKVPSVARMTPTDWLMFDLALVHEDIDVIDTNDKLGKHADKSSPLWALMRLAMTFNVDTLSGPRLAAVWVSLAKNYNSNGRECSPMLLQRRWYQLKESAREKFYFFWQEWHGDVRQMAAARHLAPSRVQAVVAKCNPSLITQPFTNWDELKQQEKVISAETMQTIMRDIQKASKAPTENDNEPEVVLMEPKIPTIDLGADSDEESNKEANKDKQDNTQTITSQSTHHITSNITVKTEPVEQTIIEGDCLDNIKIIQTTHLPTEEIDSINDVAINTNKVNLKTELDENITISETVIAKVPEYNEVKTKTEVEDIAFNKEIITSNVILESDNEDDLIMFDTTDSNEKSVPGEIKETVIANDGPNTTIKCKKIAESVKDNSVLISSEELEFVDDGIEMMEEGDEGEYLNETDKPDESEQSKSSFDTSEGIENSGKFDLKLIMKPVVFTLKLDDMNVMKDRTIDSVASEDIIEAILKESKPVINQINIQLEKNTSVNSLSNDDKHISDDIIQLAPHEPDIKTEKEAEILKAEGDVQGVPKDNKVRTRLPEETFIDKINIQLEKNTSVNSLSIDDKHISDDLIQLAPHEPDVKTEKEAGIVKAEGNVQGVPKDNEVRTLVPEENIPLVEETTLDCKQTDEDEQTNDYSSDDEIVRVSINNSIFKKPKVTEYSPIQLCKNPDFNTRLKRLNVMFYAFERNQQYLKACKPMTIDLAKTFESNLQNNTIYLKPDRQKEQLKSMQTDSSSFMPPMDGTTTRLSPPITNTTEHDNFIDHKPIIITPIEKLLTDSLPVKNNNTPNLSVKCIPSIDNPNIKYLEVAMKLNINEKKENKDVQEDKEPSPTNSNSMTNDSAQPTTSSCLVNNVTSDVNPAVIAPTTSSIDAVIQSVIESAMNSTAQPQVPQRKTIAKKKTTIAKLPWYKNYIHREPVPLWTKTKVPKTRLLPGSLLTLDALNKMLNICLEAEGAPPNPQPVSKNETTGKKKKPKKNIIPQSDNKFCCWIKELFSTKEFGKLRAHPCANTNKGCVCCCRRDDASTQKPAVNEKEITDTNERPKESTDLTEVDIITNPTEDGKNNKILEVIDVKTNDEVSPKKGKPRNRRTQKNANKKQIASDDSDVDVSEIDVTSVPAPNIIAPNVTTRIITPIEPAINKPVFYRHTARQNDNTREELQAAVTNTANVNTLNVNALNTVHVNTVDANPVYQTLPTMEPIKHPLLEITIGAPTPKPHYKELSQLIKNYPKNNTKTIDNSHIDCIELSDDDSEANNLPSVPILKRPRGRPKKFPNNKISGFIQQPKGSGPKLLRDNNHTRNMEFLKVFANQSPFHVGPNRILLTTAEIPPEMYKSQTVSKVESPPKATACEVPLVELPRGIKFAVSQDGELNCYIDRDLYDPTKMSLIPDIVERVRKQLNCKTIPFVYTSNSNNDFTPYNLENAGDGTIVIDTDKDVRTSIGEVSNNAYEKENKAACVQEGVEEKNAFNTAIEKEILSNEETSTNLVDGDTKAKQCTKKTNVFNSENDIAITKITDVEIDDEIINPQQLSTSNNTESVGNGTSNNKETTVNIPQENYEIDADTGETRVSINQENTDVISNNTANVENTKENKDKTKSPGQDQESIEIKTPLVTNKDFAEAAKPPATVAAKKTILSDLMEMSGISADDTLPELTPISDNSHILNTSPTLFQAMTCDTDAPLLPNIASVTNNMVFQSQEGTLKLTPVTSVEILKCARFQNAKFYRLDLMTGAIVSTEVSIIQKTKQRPKSQKNEVVVDLTKPNKEVFEIHSNSITGSNARKSHVLVPTTSNGKVLPKPSIFKKISLNQKKYLNKLRTLMKKPPPPVVRNKYAKKTHILKKSRKEKIEARIDMEDSDAPMEEEYLVDSSDDEMMKNNLIIQQRSRKPAGMTSILKTSILNRIHNVPKETPNKISAEKRLHSDSDDSDDEPLAKKVSRKADDKGNESDIEEEYLEDEMNSSFSIEGLIDEIMSDDGEDGNFILGA